MHALTLDSPSSEQIMALRPARVRPLPGAQPLAVMHELEAADAAGGMANVTTVLLRGSECSFRCTMCDLWTSTHLGPTPRGNLPAQIAAALGTRSTLTSAHQDWIKLYNASNFFAPYNVPTEDLPDIAASVRTFDRVVVENHPLLVSPRIERFAQALDGKLEVAMGLESVEPHVLASLNKQLTVDDVRRATDTLVDKGIDVRLFVLLRPPGQTEAAAIEWCLASIDAARQWGARHVSIIPVRAGNGAMDLLASQGQFEPPLATSLEYVLANTVGRSPLVVTADTWDWPRLRGVCSKCSQQRLQRILQTNLTQIAGCSYECVCSTAGPAANHILPTS